MLLSETLSKLESLEFNDSRDLHLVPEGSKFDIKPGQSKFLYEMLEPTKLDQPIDASGTRGIIARNISAISRQEFYEENLRRDFLFRKQEEMPNQNQETQPLHQYQRKKSL